MGTLVLAISGRALAQAARRAGAEVIVADLFGDMDTRALAPWHPLPGSLEDGIDGDALLASLPCLDDRLSGIVYGAGFESNPTLLGKLARITPLIGNHPDVVAGIKDPFAFAAMLRGLGLPHPKVATSPQPDIDWLRKRRGGSGGTHVEPATPRWATADAAHYFQARAPGEPVSALFVADGRGARVLGFSAQWVAPTLARPFRFGGCAGPLSIAPSLARDIEDACHAITAATALVGLNSLDMLVTGEAFTILEVNPRPGATLDLFDDLGGPTLWECHIEAVRGELPAGIVSRHQRARAAAIVYADRARDIPLSFDWGAGIADIPEPGSHIAAGMPICTVIADGPDPMAARAAAEDRAAALLGRLSPALRQSA